MPTAIIIGATSGIGCEIARLLHARGFRLGIAGRRRNLLDELVASLGSSRCTAMAMDVAQDEVAVEKFHELAAALGPVDYVYLVAGTGFENPGLDRALELETLRVNCLGFAALAVTAVELFSRQNHGHLVAVTSVAAVRPSGAAPAYGASKQFDSAYLEALRYWIAKKNLFIVVTEIRPGFVDTAMLKAKKPFWVIGAATAAAAMIREVERRRRVAYVPRRWRFVAMLMRMIPDRIYARIA